MSDKRPRLKPIPRTGHCAPRSGPTRRTSRKTEALVVQRLAEGALTHKQIAAETGVGPDTVHDIKKRNPELLDQLRDRITNDTLEHLNKEGHEMRVALTKDVKNPDSNTKPQSYRAMHEAGGLIGKGGGGININVDNRSLNVTLDADKAAALTKMPSEDRDAALKRRLAELAGE